MISRLLTRSGDQAWDFAVPIVLLQLFPGQLRIAAAYYFLMRLGHVVLMPHLAAVIDRVNRRSAAMFGIFLQLACVVLGAAVIAFGFGKGETVGSAVWWITFAGLVLTGLGSGLGSSFMDISIGNDLVPAAVPESDLPRFNSRLHQIDLFSEVATPMAAGAILLVSSDGFSQLGFYLIALWNVISFVPEYLLLRAVFRDRPDLLEEKAEISEDTKRSMLVKLAHGWRSFLKEPVAPSVVCYAFLWLSVLSPHGVLLTGFLKGGWHLPELWIGVFRGMGALFGLMATVLFPIVVKRLGLLRGSRVFIVFQAIALVAALVFFRAGGDGGQIGFLVMILFSRIGLYGFSLGEMQIRQVGIEPQVRGEVNGFASALTGIATLGLYGAGALLPSTDQFPILIIGSVIFVSLGAILFSLWVPRALTRSRFTASVAPK